MGRPTTLFLLAGTHAGLAKWAFDPNHPFQQLLRARNFYPIGIPWETKLGGIPLINRGLWRKEAEKRVISLIREMDVKEEDLNFLEHSHGGNVFLWVAALLRGEKRIRTNTTVATPVRGDVPNVEAAMNILYWQHIYDAKRDWIATVKRYGLGSLGDWNFKIERQFKIPGVDNKPLLDIGHSDCLGEDPVELQWWDTGLLEAIHTAGGRYVG